MQGVTSSLINFGVPSFHIGGSVVRVIKTVALGVLLTMPFTSSTKIICACENRKLSSEADLATDCDIFCNSDFNELYMQSYISICENYIIDVMSVIPFFDPNEDNYKPENKYVENPILHESILELQNVQPLESEWMSLVQILPNPITYEGFTDYRRPNEAYPEQIRSAFNEVSPGGLLICPGSERGLFTLGLAEEGLFSGLVIRDIHPKIKAYNDFNILLFRLATSIEEYKRLSEMNTTDGFRKKIEESSIPEAMKVYYLNNLDTLAFFYQEISQDWRECPSFHRVDYSKNDVMFQRIKKFADSGNIVSVVGDITDIDFLKDRKISLIDVSNIYDYFPKMTFKGSEGFHPVIVYTDLKKASVYGDRLIYLTTFYSYIFNQINKANDLSIGDFWRCKRIFGLSPG